MSPLLSAAKKIREEAGRAPPPAAVVLAVAAVAVMTLLVLAAFAVIVGLLVATLSVKQLLELTAVEEDPAAVLALIDQDAVALVGASLPKLSSMSSAQALLRCSPLS
jgi:hypothetical protein